MPDPAPNQDRTDKPKAVISSTSFDLPKHRKQVILACNRMDHDTLAMEKLTARDANAADVSLGLVDDADIYIGIFAHRYGFVPPEDNPDEISITEMEYNRAVERGIPRLIFFMHDDHNVKPKDVEKGAGAAKLDALKQRIGERRVAAFFKSAKDLRAHVVEALSQLKKRKPKQTAADFHYVHPIPSLDEPYIAHPYTLLAESRGLVGRQTELNWLTDWVTRRDSQAYASRLFFLVAIGGMGKSALTWHWFRNVAEQEMPGLAGRMWWSFYESDATFENFVIRALAYFSGQSIDDVRQLKPLDREQMLLGCLDRGRHLVVLDGLERILLAYNRHDASRLADDDLDDETANYVAQAHGLPKSAGQSVFGRHRLRMASDPRAGQFLRKLTHVRGSRVLVSTRLYPSDLQAADGFPVGNCFAYFLHGLSDEDAVDLWRRFGARGSRDELIRLFDTFERHPLLIQTLASQVCRSRAAHGDYDKWRAAHPDFNPFQLVGESERKSHILRHALDGISDEESRLLSTIAAFRMPTTYETLVALFARLTASPSGRASSSDEGDDPQLTPSQSQTDTAPTLPPETRGPMGTRLNEHELDAALTDLEDRGLLGWDRRANRYDLHPIVRGVVLGGLTRASRTDIYTTLHAHFEPMDMPEWEQVESLEDLTPAIELFNTLIELERYDDAFTVFRDRLDEAMLYRLSASHLRVELAERLFPDGVDQPPRLSQAADQGYTLNVLALGYQISGQPGAAVPVFQLACEQAEREDNQRNLSIHLCNLSDAQRLSGEVRGAEASARTALRISREIDNEFNEGLSLYLLGLALAVRSLECGDLSPLSLSSAAVSTESQPATSTDKQPRSQIQSGDKSPHSKAEAALRRSLQLFQQQNHPQGECAVTAFLAEAALWRGDPQSARSLADRAWEIASGRRNPADIIRAARLQGTAALRSLTLRVEQPAVTRLGESSYEFAHERLHHALTRARACQLVEEELATLIALAELHWRLSSHHAPRDEARDENSPPLSSPQGFSRLCTTTATDSAKTDEPADVKSGAVVRAEDGYHGSPLAPDQPQPILTSLHVSPHEHLAQARELLDDVWDRATAGPYPLFHADALNMLAAIERAEADLLQQRGAGFQPAENQAASQAALQDEAGYKPAPRDDDAIAKHRAAAITAAREAYHKAWCQGPPFAYAFGLANAKAHLDALGQPYPDMPPYDESQYEPMPDVDIIPPEESAE